MIYAAVINSGEYVTEFLEKYRHALDDPNNYIYVVPTHMFDKEMNENNGVVITEPTSLDLSEHLFFGSESSTQELEHISTDLHGNEIHYQGLLIHQKLLFMVAKTAIANGGTLNGPSHGVSV